MNLKQKKTFAAASLNSGVEGASAFELKRRPLLLVMFAGVLIAYLLLLTKNYYWDGIFFAQSIEDSAALNAQLLHPNHLIYNVVGYLFYRAARSFGLQPRAVEVLQVLNCFVGTLCAYVFFRILLECLKSVYLSAMLTLLFALSAVWWKFATDADSYILSVLFLLISFRLSLPWRRPRPYLVAVIHAAAMCFHQLAVLFFPVILLGLLLQASGETPKRRVALALEYGVTAFLITFPLFYYSFYLVTGSMSFKPFFHWVTTFSPEHGFTFNAWDNLMFTLRGHSRLFVGGRLGFLRDLKDPLMFALAGVTVILAALFFFKLIRYFRELKTALRASSEEAEKLRPLRRLLVAWIICYLIFLFFFIPQNTFYRLFYLPAIILLVGTYLAPLEASRKHVRRYRTALFVAMAAVANLTFSAYPYALTSANPPLALTLEMRKAWPQGTVIYFAAWNSDNSLVRYFNPQTVWREARPETLGRDVEELRKSGAASAWMDTTLVDLYNATPEDKTWLETHTARRPEYELVNSKYRLQFYQIKTDSFTETPPP
jgi:hypothetical protein